jgi:hypothetical protein
LVLRLMIDPPLRLPIVNFTTLIIVGNTTFEHAGTHTICTNNLARTACFVVYGIRPFRRSRKLAANEQYTRVPAHVPRSGHHPCPCTCIYTLSIHEV